jgi:hypothetical protein
LLGGIDDKKAGVRAAQQSSGKAFVSIQLLAIVNSRFVFFEVDDQFHRTVGHEALFAVWAGRVAVVKPEEVNESVERRLRNVAKNLHRPATIRKILS